MTPVLTVEQAASAAVVSEKTIYRALATGALIGSKVGTGWRIFESDLEAWLIGQRPNTANTSPRPSPRAAAPRGSLRALHTELDERRSA